MDSTGDKPKGTLTKPIAIVTRHRSFSTSSSTSSNSIASSPKTPPQNRSMESGSPQLPRSPIMQILSQSPTRTTLPLYLGGHFGPPPVFEGSHPGLMCVALTPNHVSDEPMEKLPATAHARQTSIGNRLSQQCLTDPRHERGVNLLRRLSLGSALSPRVRAVSVVPYP